ncbi:pre-rRNA processing and 40S ribosomal subunit assembly [Saitoella coloradoensis]
MLPATAKKLNASFKRTQQKPSRPTISRPKPVKAPSPPPAASSDAEDDEEKEELEESYEEMMRRRFTEQFGGESTALLDSAGKTARKRRRHEEASPSPSPSASGSEDEEGLDILHEGVSDEEEEEDEEEVARPSKVVVVDASTDLEGRGVTIDKSQKKAFMSSKAPKLDASNTTSVKNLQDLLEGDGDENDEEDDLKNDAALQKLLRESNLLKEAGGDSLELSGKARLKALQSRITELGGAGPKKERMSTQILHGIKNKARKSILAHQSRAREANIIIAKPTAEQEELTKKVRSGWKDDVRNRNAHGRLKEIGVGRFKNGSLVVSKRDIERINGDGAKRGGKGGKRR